MNYRKHNLVPIFEYADKDEKRVVGCRSTLFERANYVSELDGIVSFAMEKNGEIVDVYPKPLEKNDLRPIGFHQFNVSATPRLLLKRYVIFSQIHSSWNLQCVDMETLGYNDSFLDLNQGEKTFFIVLGFDISPSGDVAVFWVNDELYGSRLCLYFAKLNKVVMPDDERFEGLPLDYIKWTDKENVFSI